MALDPHVFMKTMETRISFSAADKALLKQIPHGEARSLCKWQKSFMPI